jgi:hypothetical protein
MKALSYWTVFAVLLLLRVAESRAEWQVWTVTGTQRVLREALAESGGEVHLAAARNEWESFQILLRSDEPVPAVRVEPGNLVGPDGSVLPAAEAEVAREHQLHITLPTYRNDQFRPGWYPDALIPSRHPLTGEPLQGKYRAMPFDLPAGETHGFWIDLRVPAEAKAGVYRGVYRVVADGGKTAEVPVELTVWDFQLPDTPAFSTALGSPADQLRSYYKRRAKEGKEPEPKDWEAVQQQVSALLCRHRINATPSNGLMVPVEQADGSFAIPKDQIDAMRVFVDRYHLNAFQTRHPSSVVKDPVAERDRLHAWLRAYDRAYEELARPQVVFFTYLRDEPNDEEEYRYVQKWGPAVRSAHSVVKVMVVEQTWTQNEAWGDLYGAVDIWCPLFSLFKPESAAKRQALGETVWTYTALCQREPTPWWHTDYPLLNYRVPAWMAWRYRMRGILYWGGMSYWNGVEDPWTEPDTLDRRKDGTGPLYNGEGTLLYPGRAAGYEGVVASMRLKTLRDGIEDYDYLAILEQRGLAEKAEAIVLPVAESFFHWEKNPQAYEEARRKLAELIVGGK